MNGLQNKTALVTGSSRGIGRAIATRLARDGALVAVHYATNGDAAAQTVALIENAGGSAFLVRAELGEPDAVSELSAALEMELETRTGTARLDILVNNAAHAGFDEMAPEEVTPEIFDRFIAVNAKAPFFLAQRALKLMSSGGRIINISSGITRTSHPGQTVYAISKAAMEQITVQLARHIGPREITINTVAAGVTNNGSLIFSNPQAVAEMAAWSAIGRVGEVADIADVVGFLASDDARWITGAYLDVSGGILAGR
ncbi:SDR family oxidoreductase [Nocardia sp. NPDC058114]|uniref:SDR family oxidoreductase n=1 Tax=Nocardia sp. NPDC058114 TaxID=3346346 RepID=UPI0036D97092